MLASIVILHLTVSSLLYNCLKNPPYKYRYYPQLLHVALCYPTLAPGSGHTTSPHPSSLEFMDKRHTHSCSFSNHLCCTIARHYYLP